jgi:hypothetical protein
LLSDDLLPPQSEETWISPSLWIERLYSWRWHRFGKPVEAKSVLRKHAYVLLDGTMDVGGSDLGGAL